jgi:Domain of unknown function (DUF6378)
MMSPSRQPSQKTALPKTRGTWDGYLPSKEAAEINIDREQKYGSPVPNMEVLALLWSICFGVEVSPQQAAMGCVLLKCMREMQSKYPDHQENLEDICGFVNVLYKTKEVFSGEATE